MIITRRSILTGVTHSLELSVTQEQLNRYERTHDLIQDVFPELSAPEREFIMTGMTPDEWDATFGEKEAA